jgi:chloramphenicol-sensitive protein RarD
VSSQAATATRQGIAAGLVAYLLWGIFPVYFKLVGDVPSLEVLGHRIVWALPFGALIIAWRGQWVEVWRALTHRRMLIGLTMAAACISLNWFVYVWAVQNDRIFDTSLGYYINPLIYVLAGVVFFRERLRRLQLIAVVLATIGVGVLTISGGTFPWVALSLAVLFTAYGIIRKRIVLGAMPGLFVETLLLLPAALMIFAWVDRASGISFGSSTEVTLLLLLAGPATVVPLLLFTVAARRLALSTVGFMQFLAPTLQFMTGVYYGEALTTPHIVCFVLIWCAVTLFSMDVLRTSKEKPLPAEPTGA